MNTLKDQLIAVGWQTFMVGRASGSNLFTFIYIKGELTDAYEPGLHRDGEVSFDKCDNPTIDPAFTAVWDFHTNSWLINSHASTTTVTIDWSTLIACVVMAILVIGVLYLVFVSGGGSPTCSLTSIIYSTGKLILC